MGAKEKTPAERMREYKRTIQRAHRELDRERNTLANEEKKLIVEIKKMAKAGQMVSSAPCCLGAQSFESMLIVDYARVCTGLGQADGEGPRPDSTAG